MSDSTTIKDSSRNFELHELFFSTTDLKGLITGCNEVFLRVADYRPDEILYKPHNIVRHPDMPRCVFMLLWQYLMSGKTIGAYVKNLAATGEYYWVYALACPVEQGYLSIRFKPTSPIFSVVQGLYSELIKIENEHSRNERREGMNQSAKVLLTRLSALGFGSYDDFMNESLRLEIESIAPILNSHTNENAGTTSSISSELSRLKKLQMDLRDKSTELRAFTKALHNLSANASVRARHVGNMGRALGVIGEEISRATQNLRTEVGRFEALVDELSSALQNSAFKLSMAFLQGEMAERFRAEGRKSQLSEKAQISRYGQKFSELSKILEACKAESSASVETTFRSLTLIMSSFNNFVDFLDKLIQTLQFGYVTGQAEVASIPDDKGFSLLLSDLNISSDKARSQLYQLRSSVQAVVDTTSAVS